MWREGSVVDLLFVNGRVLTIDQRLPRAEAVAVQDGKIVACGRYEALAGL